MREGFKVTVSTPVPYSGPLYSKLISDNLKKKYRAFYKGNPPDDKFEIKVEKVSSNSLKIIDYKGFTIKGWLGVYRIRAHPELAKLGWDAGLGAKNPQGFGMFEVVEERVENN